MTPAQIKANQAICTHRFSYDDLNSKGAFAPCLNGCGYEWGQSEDYKALQRERRMGGRQ